MGAAKNRKAEIAALKAAGPKEYLKNTKLVTFGAFYKDDEDSGFSFNFPENPALSMTKFADVISDGAAHYNEAIGVDTAWFTKELIAADLFRQMDEELVPLLCQKLYGQPTQPALGTVKHVDIVPVLSELTIFACNVKWLQDNGYLDCNDHNGMLYCYKS